MPEAQGAVVARAERTQPCGKPDLRHTFLLNRSRTLPDPVSQDGRPPREWRRPRPVVEREAMQNLPPTDRSESPDERTQRRRARRWMRRARMAAPFLGVSAVLALSYLVQDLHALNDPEKGISVNVGIIEGGLQANVIPPECRAVVDVRVPTKEDARRLEEAILGLSLAIPDTRLEISGQFGRPPLEPTPENQALWRTAEELGRELGTDLDQGMAGGGSDGNYTSLHTATLDGLGAVGDGAHADHEFIFIDKMIERAALLALLLMTP